jgi:hypothetical protein
LPESFILVLAARFLFASRAVITLQAYRRKEGLELLILKKDKTKVEGL